MRILLIVNYPNSSLDNLAKVIIGVLRDKEVEIFLIYRRMFFELVKIDPQILDTFSLVHFLNGVESFPLEIIKYISHICPIITHYHHREYTLIPKQFLFVDHLLYVSNSLLDDIRSLGISTEQTSLMRSGVDTDLFYPQKSLRRSKSFTIGFFNARPLNSYDRKGSVLLLHALRKLVDLGYRPNFLVVGYGWEKLVTDLRKMNLKVTYYANVPSDELPSLYQKLDLYLITSLQEGGPLTLLEAGACGIPIISTPVGLAPEILTKPGCGTLLKKINSEEVALNIFNTFENYEHAKEKATYVLEEIRENWVWAYSYRDLYEIYCKVSKPNKKVKKIVFLNKVGSKPYLDLNQSPKQQQTFAQIHALADLAIRLYEYHDYLSSFDVFISGIFRTHPSNWWRAFRSRNL